MRHDYRDVQRRRRSWFMVRCRFCAARRTFSMKPDDYQRMPMCPCWKHRQVRKVGQRDVWRIDWFRTSGIEARTTTCHCDALPWPHRRHSSYMLSPESVLRCG